MLLRTALGAALRRLRLERGLTLRQLSALAAVSMPYLSEVERGRKEISSELLAEICRALGIDVTALLREVVSDSELASAAASAASLARAGGASRSTQGMRSGDVRLAA